jgi:hypothetical protein
MLSLSAGWSSAINTLPASYYTFSAMLLFRTDRSLTMPSLIFGLGFGSAAFNYSSHSSQYALATDSTDIIISASQSYPMVSAGVNVIPHQLDILLTYPFAPALRTMFESVSYTIHLPGPTFSVLLTL